MADWLFHLKEKRQLSASSINIAVNAVRFLYQTKLGRATAEIFAKVPRMKRTTKRAHAYSAEKIEAILHAPRRPRDLAFLRLVYGCGLRLSEATHGIGGRNVRASPVMTRPGCLRERIRRNRFALSTRESD